MYLIKFGVCIHDCSVFLINLATIKKLSKVTNKENESKIFEMIEEKNSLNLKYINILYCCYYYYYDY